MVSFKVFIVWTFVVIGRPQDLFPYLGTLRPGFVLAVLAVGAAFMDGRAMKLPTVIRSNEAKKYILFFAVMVIGIPFALYRRGAFDFVFWNYLVNVVFFLLFFLHVDSYRKLRDVLSVLLLCAFLYSFFGLIEGSMSRGGRFEVYGKMYDSNDIVFVLVSLLPVVFFYVMHRETVVKGAVSLLSIITGILVILLSGSRGGLLAFASFIALFVFGNVATMKNRYRVLMVMIVLLISFLYHGEINVERYWSLTDISKDYNMTEETGRFTIWKRALNLILENPLTGVGASCSAEAIAYDRELEGLTPWWQDPHNSFLQVAAEIGLVGFLLFLSLIIDSLKDFLVVSKMKPNSHEMVELKSLGGLLAIGFIAQLTAAFFLSQGYSILLTLFFSLSAVVRKISSEMSCQVLAECPERGPAQPML